MTCPQCDHPRVTLLDGTTTCSWSEAWRHECEARHVCNMRDIYQRRSYLSEVQTKRGTASHIQLASAVKAVWTATRASPAGGG